MRTEGIETLKAVARRSAWIVVLLVALGIVAMTLVRRSEGPQYQASADVILSPQDLTSAIAGINPSYVDPQVLDATEQSLANSPQLYRAAADSVGRRLGSGHQLQSATSASKSGGTITFTATGSNPNRVLEIANAVAREYKPWRGGITSAAAQTAIQRVQSQLAQTPKDPALLDQLTKLKSVKDLAYGNVLLVETADSAAKTRPRPIRDGLLGAFIGLFVALLVVAVREAIDTRVRSEGEVEDLLNVPVLGTVESLPRRTTLVTLGRHRERFGDMYALLAANLVQANKDAKHSVIAVTSATAEEGKTTTASNLAAALATRNSSVVLVDLDSRKPSLSKMFHIPAEAPGIEQVMGHKAKPEEAMWTVSLNGRGGIVYPSFGGRVDEQAGASNGSSRNGSLRVLPMGTGLKSGTSPRAARLEPLIETLKKQADYVIIDTPPALSMPDMTEISELVDVVLIVVRHGRVSRRSLSSLTRIQRNWPAANVAAVLVGTPRHDEGYAYYGRP